MRKNLERMIAFGATAILIMSGAGCSDDDDGPTTPVNEDPEVELLTPNGGEIVQPGAELTIEWSVMDDSEMVEFDLAYSERGGTGFTTIAEGVSGTSFAWMVPSENTYGVRVRITATDDGGKSAEDLSDEIFAIVTASERGYVTGAVCATCHEEKWQDLRDSGHPYKLNKVVNGQPPTYPFSTLEDPPVGYAWDDISYVIGGYGWKARFMDENGYILITGLEGVPTQYNLPRDDLGDGLPVEWVNYESAATEPKPYTCGTCHTTGWLTTAENGGQYQDGLEGIRGTWEEPGISCEACHGPGGQHVASLSADQINIDTGSELCGSCHFRDTNHGILASGGFIKHHEQYDEMISAGHSNLSCTTCHDPHIGVRYGHDKTGGIRTQCQGCHGDVGDADHLVTLDCTTCHMARASKSARKVNDFQGDIATHIFKINTDPVGRNDPDGMFFESDGSTFSRGYMTLDFVCYQCHTDPVTGGGGGRSELTLEELSAAAEGMHN